MGSGSQVFGDLPRLQMFSVGGRIGRALAVIFLHLLPSLGELLVHRLAATGFQLGARLIVGAVIDVITERK